MLGYIERAGLLCCLLSISDFNVCDSVVAEDCDSMGEEKFGQSGS